jgi:beta-mannanase
MKEGSTLLVSLDSSGPSYASIAAGQHDATIMAFLKAVNRAALQYGLGSIYISFEHEPDGPQHAGFGSPAQFVRAWDHVHKLAESAGLDSSQGGRLHWVLILIHNTYAGGAGAYWPGPGEVDVVSADGYNSYRCPSGWQNQIPTPAELFNPLLSFAAAHGLPAFISEWGSDTTTPDAQPRFIQQMQAYLSSNPNITAAMYWDDGGGSCSYRVDGHPSALSAMAALGHAAVMQGSARTG